MGCVQSKKKSQLKQMKVRYLEEQITPECLSKNSLNIDLDGHNVNIQEIQRIASALQKCLNLKMLRLNLDNNLIREEGAFFLGQGLSSCTNLQMLMIGLRSIGDIKFRTHLNSLLKSEQISAGFNRQQSWRLRIIKYMPYFRKLQQLEGPKTIIRLKQNQEQRNN
ncbi:hypothetical protein ABPG73_018872 [Tetrahymena malaccensis]